MFYHKTMTGQNNRFKKKGNKISLNQKPQPNHKLYPPHLELHLSNHPVEDLHDTTLRRAKQLH